MLTWTDSKTPLGDSHTKFPSIFTKFIKDKITVWNSFLNYWQNKSKNGDVPVLFARYEDLILKPKKTLEEVFGFLLSETSLEGKVIQ